VRCSRVSWSHSKSQARITRYREQILSAPAEKSQTFVEGLVCQSKEALTDFIADETDRIADRNRQIETLKIGFREHLQHIGVNVSPEYADTLLLPVVDKIISMAAVISNISRLTEQLQELVDASKEAPADTKRYYGHLALSGAQPVGARWMAEDSRCRGCPLQFRKAHGKGHRGLGRSREFVGPDSGSSREGVRVECPIFCAVGRVSVTQLFLSSNSRRRVCGEVGSA
jgi:hypothetical protein